MLAMLNGFVLRPLPFAAPDELLGVGVYQTGGAAMTLNRCEAMTCSTYVATPATSPGGFARAMH